MRIAAPPTRVRLALAIGRRYPRTDPDALRAHFDAHGWELIDQLWIRKCLRTASESPYDDDIAVITAKLIEKNELE